MSHLLEYYNNWPAHAGKIVKINNINHKIVVDIYRQKYPYAADVIHVSAEPCNKNSKYYLEEKEKLRDDWHIDLLSSDLELYCAVLQQLEPQAATAPDLPNDGLCMCGEPWQPVDLGWGDGWLRCPHCGCL